MSATNPTAPTRDVPIDSIAIHNRHRTDLGDLRALAASIERQGLLQPIGITPDHHLVFGERRLKACRDLLNWDAIPARVVCVTSIAEGEHDENELRKDFAPSERVAIKRAVEEEIGNRSGRPSREGHAVKVQNLAPFPPGTKTRDLAAERAGFGNAETARQAESVVDHGAPELVDAMDAGAVSIHAASQIATLPEEEQREVVARGEAEILRKAKEIKTDRRKQRLAVRAAVAAASRPDGPLEGTDWRLLVGDCLDVTRAQIPAETVDAIITDPPYPVEYLDCLNRLADLAAHALVDGGHLLVMIGQSYLGEVFHRLEHDALTYQWTLGYMTPGTSVQVFGRHVKSNWKPVLWYTKGRNTWEHVDDLVVSSGSDKRFHEWGQSVDGMARIVERFTVPHQTVLDPFCGAGTTGVAARLLGRRFIGIDLDGAAVQSASERMEDLPCAM